MRMSLTRLDAPIRYRSGVSQSGPSVSCTCTRYWIAFFAVRMPPAGFMPTLRPVSSCTSRIASSITSGTGRHREQRRAAHVVVRAELRDLEDHLQVRLAAGLLHLDDLVEDLRVPA